ncbi:MAG TPA: ABC transporter ATP-binding protein [Permianibacter sp.]|nr:ABC transporter ATP-binding protein [Permianibacter sp.]
MTEDVLNIEGLHKRFADKAVLKGISASVQRGDVVGLLGLNGAGKTTLLETALGFALPDAGSVNLFGSDCALLVDEKLKHKIGFVPQQDELLPQMKGSEYLALIAQFYPGWNHALIGRLADEWQIPLSTIIQKLSLGQRQKLSILSALGHEPELLVLDEPVASLDPVARRQFLKEIVTLASSGARTVLFSTHIVSDLERVASRVWVMKDGGLLVDDALDNLKERTVRLRVPADARLPAGFQDAGILHRRTEHGMQVLTLSQWSDDHHQRLHQAGLQPLVEPLSLEDIFLELHA